LTPEQTARYRALDPQTVDRLLKGELNTPVVTHALDDPDLFVRAIEDRAYIARAEASMTTLFKDLDALAKKENPQAKTIVVSMPYVAYLAGPAANIMRKVGFNVPPRLAGDRKSEDSIATAAKASGLPFVSVLDDFQKADTSDLFVDFDGHYNAKGTAFFAHALAARLIPQLRRAGAVRTGNR